MDRRERAARGRVLVVVAFVAGAGSALTVRQIADGVALSAVVTWLDGFAHSPGLGGSAAVAAACVGLAQWRRQAVIRREEAAAARRARRDAEWWQGYRVARPDGARATYADRELVEALAVVADTEIQAVAAQVLALTMVDDEGGSRAEADRPDAP